jgi:hypothetical protein
VYLKPLIEAISLAEKSAVVFARPSKAKLTSLIAAYLALHGPVV